MTSLDDYIEELEQKLEEAQPLLAELRRNVLEAAPEDVQVFQTLLVDFQHDVYVLDMELNSARWRRDRESK